MPSTAPRYETPAKNGTAGRRVTLTMVARHAGVGVTTVSDILNRGAASKYSSEMQTRVRESVERLGYTPHRGAQLMKHKRSGVIGLLLTRDFSNPFWARFADAAEKSLRAKGFLMHLGVCDGDPDTEAVHMQRLLSEQVEGLLIGPIYEQKDLDKHRSIVRGRVPTVAYGFDETGLDTVSTDALANGRLIGEHLLGLGHRRIAVLGDPSADTPSFKTSTFGGLDAVLREAGCGLQDPWRIRHEDTGRIAAAYEVSGRFAAKWKAAPRDQRPTAVVCHNDQYAMAAICAFAETGIRVPDELSVVGHDNLSESRFTIPPLTTLDSDPPLLIDAAIDMLLQRIDDPHRPIQSLRHPGRLVVRRSAARVL